MNFKQLIKSYSFWTTLAGAIVVLVQVLEKIFNFNIPSELVHDLITAIAGVLVALGIVTMPKTIAEAKEGNKLAEETKSSEDKADKEAEEKGSEGKASGDEPSEENKINDKAEVESKTDEKED